MTKCPPPGGQWAIRQNADAAKVMFQVAYWMNRNKYPVAVLLGTDPHNAVLSHRERWVTVTGIVTQENPLAAGVTSVTLKFVSFIDQPAMLGDPVSEQVVSGAAWLADFKAVANPASAYNNQFVAIVEPPVTDGRVVVRGFPVSGTILPPDRVAVLAVRSMIASGVTQLPAFRELARLQPGRPVLVNAERGGYYIVPLGPDAKTQTHALLVNAYSGEFMRAARTPSRPVLEQSEAVRRALEYLGRPKAQYSAALVSDSRSRYAPEWRVTADTETVVVDTAGNVRRQRSEVRNGNCEVRINGQVVRSVNAKDRDDCYRQTSFGSENCAKYAEFLKSGNNLIEQYFNGTDRVNSDTCRR